MSRTASKYIGQGKTARVPSGPPSGRVVGRLEVVNKNAVSADRRQTSVVRAQSEPHPTVLVAGKNQMREPLVASLLRDNCLVLEAETFGRIVEIVKFHSRPIHVLLLDVALSDADTEVDLKAFRRAMQIVFVDQTSTGAGSAGLPPHNALACVRELLKLPKSMGQAG